MPSQWNLIESTIRGWRNIFPGVQGGGGEIREGEADSDLQWADQGDSHLSGYLFVCKKEGGGGSAIPVFFHISTYVKLGLLIQREKTKSERCTGKRLGRNMSTKEGIRLEINEHFLR